jgi:hypothetical protein
LIKVPVFGSDGTLMWGRRYVLSRKAWLAPERLPAWRQKQGIGRDEHRQLIADAKHARRSGKTQRQLLVPEGPTSEPDVPPDLGSVQVHQHDLLCVTAARTRVQTGETLTLAQVAALSQYEQHRLDRDANIRAASEGWRTRASR